MRHKNEADYFLFQEKMISHTCARSAGLNPECVRETLWAIRAQTASESNTNVA